MGMRQPRSPTVIPFPSRERPHYSCRSKDERAGSILPPQPAAPAGTAAPGTLLSPGSSSMPTCTETSASGLAPSTAPGAAGRYGQPVPARRERIQEEQGYARRQQESLAQAPEQAEGTRGGQQALLRSPGSASRPWSHPRCLRAEHPAQRDAPPAISTPASGKSIHSPPSAACGVQSVADSPRRSSRGLFSRSRYSWAVHVPSQTAFPQLRHRPSLPSASLEGSILPSCPRAEKSSNRIR